MTATLWCYKTPVSIITSIWLFNGLPFTLAANDITAIWPPGTWLPLWYIHSAPISNAGTILWRYWPTNNPEIHITHECQEFVVPHVQEACVVILLYDLLSPVHSTKEQCIYFSTNSVIFCYMLSSGVTIKNQSRNWSIQMFMWINFTSWDFWLANRHWQTDEATPQCSIWTCKKFFISVFILGCKFILIYRGLCSTTRTVIIFLCSEQGISCDKKQYDPNDPSA